MRNQSYETVQRWLDAALNDLKILSGEEIGPSDAHWQDVAGTAAVNLRCLANWLEHCRVGNQPGPIVFPEVKSEEPES